MRICDRCGGKNDVENVVKPHDTLSVTGHPPAKPGDPCIDLCEPCRFTYTNMVDGFLNHYQPPPMPAPPKLFDSDELEKLRAALDTHVHHHVDTPTLRDEYEQLIYKVRSL